MQHIAKEMMDEMLDPAAAAGAFDVGGVVTVGDVVEGGLGWHGEMV